LTELEAQHGGKELSITLGHRQARPGAADQAFQSRRESSHHFPVEQRALITSICCCGRARKYFYL
jgi:hypothetical protein